MTLTPLPRLFAPGDSTRRKHREWLVAGLIEVRSVALLIGAEKSGKSALAVELARAVATGDDFLGRSVRQGGVLYIAAERFDETMRRLEVAFSNFPGAPPVRVTGDVRDLSDCEAVSALLSASATFQSASGVPTRLIIIDTLHATIGEGDENSSRDIGRFRRSLDLMRDRTGAAIMLIHHSKRDERGQASRRARGAQALEAFVDVTLMSEGKRDERALVIARGNTVAEGMRLEFALEAVDVGPDPLTGGASSVIAVRPRSVDAQASEARLPRDSRTALACLVDMSSGEPASEQEWRRSVYEAFGSRTSDAKKVAFNKAKRVLSEAGILTIAEGLVSVSDPEAGRKRFLAYGEAKGVSAPLSLERAASAYAPSAKASLVIDPDEFGDDLELRENDRRLA